MTTLVNASPSSVRSIFTPFLNPAVILDSARRAQAHRGRRKRYLILNQKLLTFVLTFLILMAGMSLGSIEKSNTHSQKREGPAAVQSSTARSVAKLADSQVLKQADAKHAGTNSGPGSLLLRAHAGSVPFAGTPYTGTAISLPGRIEAENFDNGGEGVAYHDTTATNDGGYYRSEGVDICTCGSPIVSVGWTHQGEWMEYTVTVASYGTYKFQTLTATIIGTAALHIEVDGVNVTGQMILPNTGAWHVFAATSSVPVTLTAGQHVIRVAVDSTGYLIDAIDVIRLNTPYGGTPAQLPGTIQAENFDNGGEGIAYHDTTPTNEGGAYRSEGVDLCFCGYSEGAAVGWSQAGEWTRYTVNFSATDSYTLRAKMSTTISGGLIHLEVDGVNVTGSMQVPNTGWWDWWTTISKPDIQISAGQHELKMVIESGGFLLDSLSAIPSVPSAPSGLTASTVSTSQINLSWTDNSFNESGFKVERKTGPSGSYAEIATTAAAVSSFSNSGLQPNTQYFYRVRATNLGGHSAYSNEASATTSNLPPSVAVTSPAAGSVVNAPANITIGAAAADPDGTVSKVEFFQGSTKLGEDVSAPYSFNWTNVSAGTYNLTARATDNAGGSTTSASVAIIVNALPTISLTAPAANTVVTSPANITLQASASDADGSITKVEFFRNGVLLGEDTTSPYSYVWANAPTGVYSVTARATDNRSATTTSAAVTITVNNPPSVSITAPAANFTFVAGATVSIEATAGDTDGTISKVEFYQGTTKLGEDLTAPFAFSWSNVPQGSYSLSAVATDNRGASTTSAAVPINVFLSSVTRLDPMNATGGGGENPLSRNFNWSLPLLSLPGRAGMDLSLTLSYNSLVWTRSGNLISFDDDKGFPGPGFRLGFPVIQPLYYNSEVGKYAYLLISPDGSRTELRQVGTSGTSNYYEAADSSYLLLDSSTMILRTADGTQFSYAPHGGEFQCTQIKDRNGNYITINYNPSGRIANIHDTLDRVITFNYNNGRLSTITQTWKKPTDLSQTITHTWASFSYAELEIQTNFSGLSVVGPSNGTKISVLSKVTLDDNSTTPAENSHFAFDYTSWGQIWKINNFAADNHLLNYRSYKLPGSALWANPPAQTDCPRFTERRDWAEKWNQNAGGTEQEAVTSFAALQAGTANVPGQGPQPAMFVQVTNPDGTFAKIYFLGSAGTPSGWRVGLPYVVDSYEASGTIPERQAVTTWEQDNESVSYVLNPRVKETNVYDAAGNRKRTRITYQQFTPATGSSYKLSRDVLEYGPAATTVLRSTRTNYVDGDSTINATYQNRRILGLVSERTLYDGDVNSSGTLMSRVGFSYDEAGSIQGTDMPVQHDNTNYNASLVAGRGNASTVKRYDVNNGQFTASTMKYNTAGAVVSLKDPLGHEVKIDYADAFSDNESRNTLAYPTKVTDPDNYFSKSWYNFDFGAVTKTRRPPPNVTGTQNPNAGPEVGFTYDDLGRLDRTTNLVNNAYSRVVYHSSGIRIDTYRTIENGEAESRSFKITDGLGRVIGAASDHASTPNKFTGQRIVYDVMGRIIKTSNPTETSAIGNNPLLWLAAGEDESRGWVYTQQTYDWKGRPRITTNPSLTNNPNETTTIEANYNGCGCAGGEVVTITDEGTIDGGVPKRRQQKIYSDVLGRSVKTELLNWQNGSVYSTTVVAYNARDQVTSSTRYEGLAGSSNYRQTSLTYDGFGRLLTSHSPEQQAEPNNSASSDHTTFHYNADDTINSVTDARGVVKTFSYNNRHLVTGISYDVSHIPPTNITVMPTAAATFAYDAAGNRTSMADGSGTINYHYNSLSQLAYETRQFAGPLAGVNYTLNYEYNLGGKLKKITDHTNTTINYNYYKTGALKSVGGENNLVGQVSSYASNIQYRAWGAVSQVSLGNGTEQHTEFNARLLPSSFSINNVMIGSNSSAAMSWTYDYYNDGRQRHALGAYDDRFDRLLEYDQVGRLKEAFSGREARGLAATSPIPDSPYRQTFQHNAFDERTEKSGRFWRTSQSGTTPCTPRQVNDSCDAEGNVVNFGNLQRYDAAGKQVRFENWRQTVGDGTVNHPVDASAVIDQSYDANGQAAKRVETRRTETLVNGGAEMNISETVTTTYYLYSTVLGGAKVVELDANGNKRSGYVYANGSRLAKQVVQGANEVIWHHSNPGSNSWIETGVERVPGQQEMDPDGAAVGLEDPWRDLIEPVEPSYLKMKEEEPLYIEGGDPFDYSTGLTIDGLPVSQAEFDRRMRSGSAGVQVSIGGRPVVFATNQQQLRQLTLDVFKVHNELTGLPQSQRWGGTYFIGTIDMFLGEGRRATVPQNTGFKFGNNAGFSDDEKRRLNDAFDKLKSKECQEWFGRQLSQFGPPAPGEAWYQTLDAVLGDSVLNKYDTNLTAEQMGISQSNRDEIAKKYDNRYTSLNVANATTIGTRIWLMPEAFWNNSTIPWNDRDLTGIIVHELFHVAGYGKAWESRIKGLSNQIKRHCSKTTGII